MLDPQTDMYNTNQAAYFTVVRHYAEEVAREDVR